jgi:hypothetical protein
VIRQFYVKPAIVIPATTPYPLNKKKQTTQEKSPPRVSRPHGHLFVHKRIHRNKNIFC